MWFGGYLYDLSGSYMPVWWLAAALGVVAALLNLPVREDHVRSQPHQLFPGAPSSRHEPPPRPHRKIWLYLVAGVVLTVVFLAYFRRTHSDLANFLWRCA